jgi:hypothetical protein
VVNNFFLRELRALRGEISFLCELSASAVNPLLSMFHLLVRFEQFERLERLERCGTRFILRPSVVKQTSEFSALLAPL